MTIGIPMADFSLHSAQRWSDAERSVTSGSKRNLFNLNTHGMAQFNIYEEITNRILAEIDNGIIPWHKPWTCSAGAVSHTNGRPYSLLNQILLGVDVMGEVPEYREYLTLKQVNAEGGKVKKGEKSKWVVFWKMYQKERIKDDGEKVIDTIPLLKYYHVFEVGQCEGITRKWEPLERKSLVPVEEAENIISAYFNRETCKLRICESDKACYSPLFDTVTAPQMTQFGVVGEYYSTLFHEMVHSTGHKSRLNRFEDCSYFGSEAYSKEELVAEMGAAFLIGKVGIDTQSVFRNSVAYLQGWSRKLREDKYLFVSAAGKAEAAVKYIINGKEETK